MDYPQIPNGPSRKQIIDALRNTAQSASNMVAENVSVPVDAIAWALRKAGLPIDKPVMGSDYMREKGLTAPTQEGASKMVGDTIGMIAPMGLSKAGAQAMIEAGSKLKGLPVGMSIKDVSGPQSEALRLAQERAALPIEKGGLGLGPANTAAERAKAMGFDTPAYHVTDATDIKSFDLSKLGENTARNTDSKWAERLAKSGVWSSADDLSKQMYSDVSYPLLITKPKYKSASLDALERKIKRDKILKDITQVADEEFNTTSYVIPNPDQIRSRFAAFDPWRKTAATAAAMGVAAPDLLAQELNNGNR